MTENNFSVDQAKLKKGLITALKVVGTAASAAAVVNPLFGLAGSLIQVVVKHIDDEDMRNLEQEFKEVNERVDQLNDQVVETLKEIRKDTLHSQYREVEEDLKNQFKAFMEMVTEPEPEKRKRKAVVFVESYERRYSGDQRLHTLYDGVVASPRAFSRPILEVYLEYSQADRPTMERLCTHLAYLFCIGLTTLMSFSAIIGDDEEYLREQWAEKMKRVKEKMQEALDQCK